MLMVFKHCGRRCRGQGRSDKTDITLEDPDGDGDEDVDEDEG